MNKVAVDIKPGELIFTLPDQIKDTAILAEMEKKYSEYTEAQDAYFRQNKTRSMPVEVAATFPHASEVDNDFRSSLEVASFFHVKPERYSAYFNAKATPQTITTWTGELLAVVTHKSFAWTNNFGAKFTAFRCVGINGEQYAGLRCLSNDSDLVRFKKLKSKPQVTVTYK